MKRTLIILLFLPFSFAYGQKLEYGLTTGLNLSTLQNEPKFDQYFKQPDYQYLLGIRFGGLLAFAFDEEFKIKTELAYSMAGAKSDNIHLRLHNLSAPFLVVYSPAKWVNFEAGPEINFLLDVTMNGASNGDYSSIFDKFDYGLDLGVEIKVVKKVGISLRNYFGLKYNSEMVFSDASDTIKLDRSNVISLSVNYYIRN